MNKNISKKPLITLIYLISNVSIMGLISINIISNAMQLTPDKGRLSSTRHFTSGSKDRTRIKSLLRLPPKKMPTRWLSTRLSKASLFFTLICYGVATYFVHFKRSETKKIWVLNFKRPVRTKNLKRPLFL